MAEDSRESRLQEIYDDSGRPGAEAFRYAVNKEQDPTLTITSKEAKEFVAKQSIGQVFRGNISSDGVIPGGGRDDHRWQMDLMDMSKKNAKINGQHRYVLVAVDNYDRSVYAEPIKAKTAENTLTAFRKIIQDNDNVIPREITADLGGEFREVEKYIKEHGNGAVLRRKNVQAVNTLAVVDRVIGKLKTILSSEKDLGSTWAQNMEKATRRYNEKQHSYLMGTAPKFVKETPLLQYELEKTHGEQIQHNNQKWRDKVDKLQEKGALRIPKDRNEWEHLDVPKWKGEVYDVKGFKGANVQATDSKGKEHTFPVKTSLAVPAGSAELDLGKAESHQGKKAKQREVLQSYANELYRELPSSGLKLKRVERFIKSQPGAVDDMDFYGPAKSGRYAAFVKLFPEKFEVRGSGPNLKVYKKERQVSAPRPVEEAPRERARARGEDRAPRAQEVNPRRDKALYPDDTPTIFSDVNPGRRGSDRWHRYEKYKTAKTVGEARRLGMTPQDISADVDKLAVTFA